MRRHHMYDMQRDGEQAQTLSDKSRIGVLISGRGSNMAALLYAAKAPHCPYTLCTVGSNVTDAAGLSLAKAEGIPTFAIDHKGMPREDHEMLIEQQLQKAGADYIVLAGYMRILSAPMTERWRDKILNIHPSLLPKYKGLNTHKRALDAGDKYSGCSVHIVNEGLDDGEVLGQTKVAIIKGDNADSIAARTLFAEHQLYPAALTDYVTRYRNPHWIKAQIERRALAFPETYGRISHGAPGWRVGTQKNGKFFAHFLIDHHGDKGISMAIKSDGPDEQAHYIEEDPDQYYLPQYYGKAGWLGIRLDRKNTDWDHINDWLQRSWKRVAPKKLTKSYGPLNDI